MQGVKFLFFPIFPYFLVCRGTFGEFKDCFNYYLLKFVPRLSQCFCSMQIKESGMETHFDPTAVTHNLGLQCSNRMPHDTCNTMFADCDLSPLCPTHSFTVILLLLSKPTQDEVSCEGSVTTVHAQYSQFRSLAEV